MKINALTFKGTDGAEYIAIPLIDPLKGTVKVCVAARGHVNRFLEMSLVEWDHFYVLRDMKEIELSGA